MKPPTAAEEGEGVDVEVEVVHSVSASEFVYEITISGLFLPFLQMHLFKRSYN